MSSTNDMDKILLWKSPAGATFISALALGSGALTHIFFCLNIFYWCFNCSKVIRGGGSRRCLRAYNGQILYLLLKRLLCNIFCKKQRLYNNSVQTLTLNRGNNISLNLIYLSWHMVLIVYRCRWKIITIKWI